MTAADVWVMAPMVATAAEAAGFAERVRALGLAKAGVMIEVPAAALRARRFLDVVDFLSIGTNDLSQYTLAADRQTGDLADLLDPWQPALLELIAGCAAAGRAAGKPVGICGEAAADPLLAPVLAGLGITKLSMSPRAPARGTGRAGRAHPRRLRAPRRARPGRRGRRRSPRRRAQTRTTSGPAAASSAARPSSRPVSVISTLMSDSEANPAR